MRHYAAEAGDPRSAAIADRLAAPLRVAVSGRHGVGLSTVTHAVARAGELRGTVAVTTSPQAEVDVYVLTEVVKPEDREAIAATGRPAVVVLNKADLVATTQPGLHPGGPTAAARARCALLSAHTGRPIEPVVGLLAVAALDDLLDHSLWAALQVLAAGHVVAAEVRRRLLDTLGVFGVEQALAAIRGGATRAQIRARLRDLSSIDDVIGAIGSAGTQVHYGRLLTALADLTTLAVTDGRVGEFLSRDDTVVARMAAAVNVVEAAGARGWQRYSRGPVTGLHRSCAADIVRGSLRLWSKAGSSA